MTELAGTSVYVPTSVAGFEEVRVVDGPPGDDGRPSPTAVYARSGPIDGTLSGTLSAAAIRMSGAHEALASSATDSELTEAVRSLDGMFGYEGAGSTIRLENGYPVYVRDAAEVIPGEDIGYADRVYDVYIAAGSAPDEIVYVATDSLDSDEVLAFLRQVRS